MSPTPLSAHASAPIKGSLAAAPLGEISDARRRAVVKKWRSGAAGAATLVLGLCMVPAEAREIGHPRSSLGNVGPQTAPTERSTDEGRELRLADAIALALERSPELAFFAAGRHAAEAREIQAALRPNPEIGFRAEDIGVSGVTRGVDQAEMTIELGQLIELGGKRTARMSQASRDRELATWDYGIARAEVLARVARSFIAVLVAQEQLALAAESAAVTRQVVDAVSLRVRAGSTSTIELTKAEIAVASASLDEEAARRELTTARRRLAQTWGQSNASFERAVGTLDQVDPVPDLNELQARVEASPDLARWTTELLERQAAIELEKAKAVPDLTASAGYRRLFDPDENTFVVGLSIPLPFANRNEGAIEEAEHRLTQSRAEQQSARVGVAAALADAHQALATAQVQITTLDSDVLPGAREAFRALNEGYREGRFSYLEVLDAQRTLLAARTQRVRALGDYHQAVVTLERLLGEPLTPATRRARERD